MFLTPSPHPPFFFYPPTVNGILAARLWRMLAGIELQRIRNDGFDRSFNFYL